MDNVQKIENKDTESAIEAILFAAGHPVAYSKLAEVLGFTEATIKKKVKAFATKYNAVSGRGIMMLTFETSAQLCTKEKFLPLIKEALGIRKGGNLSASSLEVLAIIAYNEPVTRAFIDTVRKVDSAYVVNNLCEKNLIEACGRLDVPGRPNIYRTTPTFLRCFGIDSLEQLPYVDVPRAKPEGEIIPLEIPEGEIPVGESDNNENTVNGGEDSENDIAIDDDTDLNEDDTAEETEHKDT